MAKREILAGATDQTIDIFIQDSSSTTGQGLAGLVFNSASLACYYRKGATGSATALTLATQTVGGAHSDGGFVEIQATNMKGVYRLDLSDTIVASAGMVTIVLYGATNMAPCVIELEIVSVNKFDAVRMGMTALPNANAEAAGGLYTRGSGAGQINQPANGLVDVNVENWNTTAVPAEHTAGYPIVTIKDGTGTGEINTNAGAIALVDLVTTVTTLTNLPTIPANWLTAAGTAADFATELRTAINGGDWALSTNSLGMIRVADGTATGEINTNSGAIALVDLVTAVTTLNGLAAGTITSASIAAETGLRPSRSGTLASGGTFSVTLDGSASSVNDFYKGQLLTITGGTGAGQDAIVSTYNGTTKVATLIPALVTAADGTSTFALTHGSHNVSSWQGGEVATVYTDGTIKTNAVYIANDTAVAGIRTAVGLASANLDTQLAAIKSDTAATLLDTGTDGVVVNAASLATDAVNEIRNAITGGAYALNTDSGGSIRIVDGTGTGEIALTGGAIDSVLALGTQAKADVNAEVLDVLTVDTFAEPSQGAPPSTASILNMLKYQYVTFRNKKTQTSSEMKVFADDITTVLFKSAVSDDGTTLTVGEMATGA